MTADAQVEEELRRLLNGRLMTPTLVVGKEVLAGFAQNRARMEELFPRPKAEPWSLPVDRQEDTMAELDVVCGMRVEPDKAAATSVYQGKTYYFCAKGCKVAFDRDPEKYLNQSAGRKGMSGQ